MSGSVQSTPYSAHARRTPHRARSDRVGLRALCESIPSVAFVSDVTDVVYVNYLVDADRIAPLIPPGLDLQRIGESGDRAMLTFLTYHHGHLGPALLGRWRRLLPSPLQSNWRVYVHHSRTNVSGVYFLSTVIDRTPSPPA